MSPSTPSARTLITGADGLLGSALRTLIPDAVAATRAEADLRDPRAVSVLFERVRPDAVIHLAAEVGGVKRNAAHNAELLADNVLINTNVLESARRSGVARLLAVLSSCAYQYYDDRPSTEDDLHVGLPFAGNLGYGFSKRLLDIHARVVRTQHGWGYGSITPATMYGPNDDFDLESGHVVAALIHKCWKAKTHGTPLEVWGSGRAIRQFVYVRDVARAVAAAIERPPENIIITADRGIRIVELAQAVADALDFEGPIVFDATKPEGAAARVLESRGFERTFPGFRFTPLAQGLRETARWFVERHSKVAA